MRHAGRKLFGEVSESAALIRDMTAILNRTPKGQPTGGEFSAKNRDESTVALDIQVGDTIRNVPAPESRAIVENSLAEIDRAWANEEKTTSLVDEAGHAGSAHAHAEVVSYINSDNLRDYNYEAQGEKLLNDRREGYRIEEEKNFTGPGELTAMKRQMVVSYCRNRADELFAAAESEPVEDAASHMFGRSETFADLAMSISAPSMPDPTID